MEERGIDALYLISPANVRYFTNFEYIQTERPFALILKKDGESAIFCPLLEEDHVRRYAYVEEIFSYPEYPGERHPMCYLGDALRALGLKGKTIGYDGDGYGHIMGYRGPKLSEVFPEAKYVYARDLVEEIRMVKSEAEIRALRESSKWTTLAHALLQEYTAPGLYEDEISMVASYEATMAMIRANPGGKNLRAVAGFRGQIGPHSYFPHSLSVHARIKPGEVLVTGARARIEGYSVELERTLIASPVEERKRKLFEAMVKAQEIALETIGPGVKCSEVDMAVRRYFKEKGLQEYWRHHTGHGIGLEIHEAPFFDIGDRRELKPGMVMSVEPGIYVPDLGGFRFSDTVLVVEDGAEVLTNYPRELDSLIVRFFTAP